MNKIKQIYWLLTSIILFSHNLLAAPAFEMPNTQMHELSTNKTINKDYLLYVHLPSPYDASKSYPVLYLLDAWWDFPVVAGAYSGMAYDGVIPPMIIVGIGLADLDADPNILRNSDYTPTKTSLENSGDAAAFLNFVTAKAIPFIEKTYAVDKQYKVLAGSSYGGLFTLYTLYEKPNLFQGHIAISPAVNYDNNWLFQRASSSAATGNSKQLKGNLYMTVGEKDQIPNFVKEIKAFNQVLTHKNYPNLNLKFEVRKNEYHASVKLGAFSQGLAHAFRPYLENAH